MDACVTEPEPLAFSYTGFELAPLLEQLLASHIATIAELDKKLDTFTLGQKAAAMQSTLPKPTFEYDGSGNLRTKFANANNECAATLHARDEAWIAKRECELWLLEAYRTPNTRWQLTLKELARLYPEQSAASTLASLKAGPPAPLSAWSRLVARLAAWLSPRRPALHGPSLG